MKILIFSFLAGCSLSVSAQQQLDVQAHRGGRALMPENTIPAMLNAVKLGARTLELDCVISSDKKVLVSHDVFMSSDIMLKPDDSTIDKADEKKYALYTMTYDSIRKFDEGTKPHPQFPDQARIKTYKPLLSALIDSVELYVKQHHLKPVYYNMETKSSPAGDGIYHPKPDEFMAMVMDVVKQKGIADRVIIQSFDVRTLQILHKTDPTQKTALLIMNKDSYEQNIATLGFTPTIYSPYYTLVTEDLVTKAHAANVQVLPWTVNKEEDMKKLGDLHVDGIITDDPKTMVALFGSYQTK
ncbi:glycerophosphodiester phosphodiesterase family protein [Chitinophagaceae bacterium LWZ2-11]